MRATQSKKKAVISRSRSRGRSKQDFQFHYCQTDNLVPPAFFSFQTCNHRPRRCTPRCTDRRHPSVTQREKKDLKPPRRRVERPPHEPWPAATASIRRPTAAEVVVDPAPGGRAAGQPGSRASSITLMMDPAERDVAMVPALPARGAHRGRGLLTVRSINRPPNSARWLPSSIP